MDNEELKSLKERIQSERASLKELKANPVKQKVGLPLGDPNPLVTQTSSYNGQTLKVGIKLRRGLNAEEIKKAKALALKHWNVKL